MLLVRRRPSVWRARPPSLSCVDGVDEAPKYRSRVRVNAASTASSAGVFRAREKVELIAAVGHGGGCFDRWRQC